jgi:SAM-dependent methyltransferase
MASATCDAEAFYEVFAPFYDDFTADHEYAWWLGELLRALEREGQKGNCLLDVGCGTGKSFRPMLERGWQITGCDISPAMVEEARRKAGDTVRLSVADMRELPKFGEFDLVWALYDAINYLLDARDLEAALSGMEANLAPGGLLIFDVLTLQGCRTFFTEEQRIERAGRRMTWRGEGHAGMQAGAICTASLEVEMGERVVCQPHRQKHFPETEMLEALGAAGLECLEVYGSKADGILRSPLNEAIHTKAIYVATRRATP